MANELKKKIAEFLNLKEENAKLKEMVKNMLFEDIYEYFSRDNKFSSSREEGRVNPFHLASTLRLLLGLFDEENVSKEKIAEVVKSYLVVVRFGLPAAKKYGLFEKVEKIAKFCNYPL